jgi:hypothetical protein
MVKLTEKEGPEGACVGCIMTIVVLLFAVVLTLEGWQGCRACSECTSIIDFEGSCLDTCFDDGQLAASPRVPGAAATVQTPESSALHDPLILLGSACALVALLAASAAVHYRRKAIAAVADAKPQQEGEEREENVARDSTAETATLAGKSMKQTSDASYP